MVWCIMNNLDYKAAKENLLEKRVPFFEYIGISDLGSQSVLCTGVIFINIKVLFCHANIFPERNDNSCITNNPHP